MVLLQNIFELLKDIGIFLLEENEMVTTEWFPP